MKRQRNLRPLSFRKRKQYGIRRRLDHTSDLIIWIGCHVIYSKVVGVDSIENRDIFIKKIDSKVCQVRQNLVLLGFSVFPAAKFESRARPQKAGIDQGVIGFFPSDRRRLVRRFPKRRNPLLDLPYHLQSQNI